MLSLDDLLDLIDQLPLADLPDERVHLDQAGGRVLAQPVHVPFDQPVEPLSAMDGYAFRYADIIDSAGQPDSRWLASADNAAQASGLAVSQRVPAGSAPGPLAAGTVARIFTGAVMPPGSDTVVMQENVAVQADGSILFTSFPVPGYSVRKPGDELKAGDLALPSGTLLSAGAIALLASMGITQVLVRRALRVGMLFTGDELRQPGEPLGRGQIYNSNRWMWRELMARRYIELHDHGQVADNLEATCDAMQNLAQRCDLVISSGGVSVGEEDHVKAAVERLGTLQAWKVAMKPGKPIAVGQLKREDGSHAVFVGLPGNPVSSYAGFLLLLRPLLWRLAGGATGTMLPLAALQQQRVAAFKWLKPDAKRTEFLRARLNPDGTVALHANQQSAALASVAWADGFVRVSPGLVVQPGDPVTFLAVSALALP